MLRDIMLQTEQEHREEFIHSLLSCGYKLTEKNEINTDLFPCKWIDADGTPIYFSDGRWIECNQIADITRTVKAEHDWSKKIGVQAKCFKVFCYAWEVPFYNMLEGIMVHALDE